MDVRHTSLRPARRLHPSVKRFTLELANQSLPLVRRIVQDVVREYTVVKTLEGQAQRAAQDGRTEQVLRLQDDHANRLDALRELADELTVMGVELKDGEKGLVDFPATRDGRDVYLCWRLGEPCVNHWHELDAGFVGRQRLREADAI